jgi:Helix-turn-helix domain
VSGRYLSLAEREKIALWVAARKPVRQIARELGRPDFDAVAGRFEKDGLVEGWATVTRNLVR